MAMTFRTHNPITDKPIAAPAAEPIATPAAGIFAGPPVTLSTTEAERQQSGIGDGITAIDVVSGAADLIGDVLSFLPLD